MTTPRLFLCLLLWLACLPGVEATSRVYLSLEALVDRSDVVAIVRYTRADASRPVRADTVALIESLKGEAPEKLTIHHGSQRDDHLFQQGTGDYLVFLKKSGDRFVPADGWPSSKLIREGNVTGWNNTHRFDGETQPLSGVRAAITAASAP